MMSNLDLRKMCDRCLRILGDNEELVGFKMEDGLGNVRAFKGHKDCVEEIIEILKQLYGGASND